MAEWSCTSPPKGESHQEVTVAIAKGTGENAVARAIRDALKAQLDSKRFQVAGNTVAGVRPNPDKERYVDWPEWSVGG